MEENDIVKDDDKKEKIEVIQESKENKISLNQYFNSFISIKTIAPSIVSGGRKYEEYILLYQIGLGRENVSFVRTS